MRRQKLTVTDNIKRYMTKISSDRQRRMVEQARRVADTFEDLAAAVGKENKRLSDALVAMKEVVSFVEEINSGIGNIHSHAREDAELARDHATDAANTATLAMSIPSVLAMTDVPAWYTIPAVDEGERESHVHRVINMLSVDLEQRSRGRAGQKLRVGLIIQEEGQE